MKDRLLHFAFTAKLHPSLLNVEQRLTNNEIIVGTLNGLIYEIVGKLLKSQREEFLVRQLQPYRPLLLDMAPPASSGSCHLPDQIQFLISQPPHHIGFKFQFLVKSNPQISDCRGIQDSRMESRISRQRGFTTGVQVSPACHKPIRRSKPLHPQTNLKKSNEKVTNPSEGPNLHYLESQQQQIYTQIQEH